MACCLMALRSHVGWQPHAPSRACWPWGASPPAEPQPAPQVWFLDPSLIAVIEEILTSAHAGPRPRLGRLWQCPQHPQRATFAPQDARRELDQIRVRHHRELRCPRPDIGHPSRTTAVLSPGMLLAIADPAGYQHRDSVPTLDDLPAPLDPRLQNVTGPGQEAARAILRPRSREDSPSPMDVDIYADLEMDKPHTPHPPPPTTLPTVPLPCFGPQSEMISVCFERLVDDLDSDVADLSIMFKDDIQASNATTLYVTAPFDSMKRSLIRYCRQRRFFVHCHPKKSLFHLTVMKPKAKKKDRRRAEHIALPVPPMPEAPSAAPMTDVAQPVPSDAPMTDAPARRPTPPWFPPPNQPSHVVKTGSKLSYVALAAAAPKVDHRQPLPRLELMRRSHRGRFCLLRHHPRRRHHQPFARPCERSPAESTTST